MTTTAAHRSQHQAHKRAIDTATTISLIAVIAAIIAQAAAGKQLHAAQIGILVAGLTLGLPHGATDHLQACRLFTRKSLPVVVAVYAGIACAGFVAFQLWPLPALAVFVMVSAAHFASGETAFAALRTPRAEEEQLLGQFALGITILVLPVAAQRSDTEPLLAELTRGHGAFGESILGHIQSWVVIVAVLVIAAAVLQLVVRRRTLDACELVLLTVLFTRVAPLAAFGVYFGAWHSVRHIARLVADDSTSGSISAVHSRLAGFARQAAFPTLAALLVVGWLRWHTDSWLTFISGDLAILAGLTIPHLLVVAAFDRAGRRAP